MTNTKESPKFTPGPWWVPHFTRDDIGCDCKTILGEHGPMGGIARIQVNNGLPVGEGGNDAPPLEEAIANAHLIAAAPDMYGALDEWLEIDSRFTSLEEQRRRWPEVTAKMQAALRKAGGSHE